MIPIVVILLAAALGVGVLSTHKSQPPQQAQVQQHHKKHKAAQTLHPIKPLPRAVQSIRQPQVPVADGRTDVASSGEKPIPTAATNIDDLTAQCQQHGIDEVLKTSFRENSGLEPIQVNGVIVNPKYAQALISHGNLNALFPCMAMIATDTGEFLLLFEFKEVSSIVLITGQVTAREPP